MSTSLVIQVSAQVPARDRLTRRLREALAGAIAGSNRAVADVAANTGSPCAPVTGARVRGRGPVAARTDADPGLGIDETGARTARWILEEAGAHPVWRRSDPWMTSFVDADPTHAGRLLGLAPGRSGSWVRAWLGEQTAAFRDAVELVVIDPPRRTPQ